MPVWHGVSRGCICIMHTDGYSAIYRNQNDSPATSYNATGKTNHLRTTAGIFSRDEKLFAADDRVLFFMKRFFFSSELVAKRNSLNLVIKWNPIIITGLYADAEEWRNLRGYFEWILDWMHAVYYASYPDKMW